MIAGLLQAYYMGPAEDEVAKIEIINKLSDMLLSITPLLGGIIVHLVVEPRFAGRFQSYTVENMRTHYT
jgi:hypothetical protein